jgi:uncharacterized BrkB/YihY/UPF0761 family membrane protein
MTIRSRADTVAAWASSAKRHADRVPGSSFMRDVYRAESALGGTLLEAGVAFRLFLWLVPFGLFVAAVLSFWVHLDSHEFVHEVREFGLSAAAAHGGSRALDTGEHDILIILPFALVMLVWFSLGAIRALNLSYALAWRVEPSRLHRPLTAIGLFNAIFVVASLVFVISAWLRERIGGGSMVGIAFSLLILTGLSLLGSWLLPHPGVRLVDLVPGAAFIAVGYELVAVVVIYYFAPKLGRAEAAYGAFGTAATLLIWLYVVARLVVGAAFLNAVIYSRRTEDVDSADVA